MRTSLDQLGLKNIPISIGFSKIEKFLLTIGTLRWLNFRVASDLDRGLKLSKRLVLRVGGVFSPSLAGFS